MGRMGVREKLTLEINSWRIVRRNTGFVLPFSPSFLSENRKTYHVYVKAKINFPLSLLELRDE